MLFSSFVFLFVFLPLVLCFYFLLKTNYRNFFLLIASLAFYAWGEPKFVLVMLASISINYFFGLLISTCRSYKKLTLILGILLNIGILVYFKYYNFLFIQIQSVLSLTPINVADWTFREVFLPIGISFFTFQGMSYLIDTYKKIELVQKNFFKLALYIALFPQLIAGPIVRYDAIAAQIDNANRTTSLDQFASGMKLFMIGLGKKILIANTMAVPADYIFSLPFSGEVALDAPLAWLGIICYTFQIYFDFSGYSDMAIGLGKIFGFTFPVNFNYPYISKSMTDFWRRWHMSLSSWFRDYMYISLGGNRVGNHRTYFNLLVVFVATGLWHGANWTFLFWGLWHGLFLVVEKFTNVKNWVYTPVRTVLLRIYVILVFVLGWVLFRSETLSDAIKYIGKMFSFDVSNLPDFLYFLNNKLIFFLIVAVLASTPIFKSLFARKYLGESIAFIIFILSIMYLADSTYNPFLYFRF